MTDTFLITLVNTIPGSPQSLVFPEWGNRTLTYPLNDYDILTEFTYDEIVNSASMQSFLDLGYIVAVYNGTEITTSNHLTSGDSTPFKKLTYTGDFITKQEIFADNTETDLQYTMDYTYDGNDLITNIQVTRHSDSFVYNQVFTYDLNNILISTEKII